MIIGIEGGIGTGKTITGVWFILEDAKKGKIIYTNCRLNIKDDKNINYLTKENIYSIFDNIKTGKIDMENSTVFLQEAHNYIDSRNSMSKKNKVLSYWILQSRHTGKGSCDIIYDTQDFSQVDIRLRRNTDMFIRPYIVKSWSTMSDKGIVDIPEIIFLEIFQKVRHKVIKSTMEINVKKCIGAYDTHEIVDF